MFELDEIKQLKEVAIMYIDEVIRVLLYIEGDLSLNEENYQTLNDLMTQLREVSKCSKI